MTRGVSTRRRVRVIRHLAILDTLDPSHHDDLRAKLRSTERLTDIYRWLVALGCKTSLPQVCQYRKALAEEDRRRRKEQDAIDDAAFRAVYDGHFARDLARNPDPAFDRRRYAETVLAFGELLMFESLLCLKLEDPSSLRSLRRLNRYGEALTVLVDARARFEKTRRAAERDAAARRSPGMN